ncbi:hypothetical protein FUT69_03350 [Xylella taiwanensis]|uniref:Uncharacterized protein n=1 Tax=Xylella taiwanensis TaxID=1444770 RepID=Z9JJJ0_9GAMM|nr:hypothetical protein [Xylella taiwanensis]AXI84335.1 hypothetical protein AB672_10530 [Xylella taiwanensis]EWS78138.1 hypothetical protein AF72_07415 [Xylella taiwanensis]MCD8457453.1 hypothetical protein [Xylella taiwanensis]MCD8457611.1 hypothetical protein [Xylella taiwanensis]MCD8461265.1 hypothetical protein [Xylella taiwanensis]
MTDSKKLKTAISSSGKNNTKAIPDAVKQRFIQIDNTFHFPDKTRAFEDCGRQPTTHSENQEAVRA